MHDVIKSNLKSAIRGINGILLDTLASCVDVNRNVMCNPNSLHFPAHARPLQTAQAISDHLPPRTRDYHKYFKDF